MKKLMDLENGNAVQFTPGQLENMGSMYLQGFSARRLAAIYGISQHSVLRRLHALGVPVRHRGSKAECARLMAASQ